MPTLVHLTDIKNSKAILNSGLKIEKGRAGIYCMPMLQNFYVTHQWLRELKSSGVKTIVGVYFKLESSELIFAGKYGTDHQKTTVGQAIKEIMNLKDPLGYELIVHRKILPVEILKIKNLPQTMGWRYMPDSHNRKPCNCELCIKGTIKANRLRKNIELNKE